MYKKKKKISIRRNMNEHVAVEHVLINKWSDRRAVFSRGLGKKKKT